MLSEGDQAPDFELAAHDGTRVKLSDHNDSYVLRRLIISADSRARIDLSVVRQPRAY